MGILPLVVLATLSALDPGIQRLAEEAEVFAKSLPNMIGEETIRQKALQRKSRFHFRIGESAFQPEEPSYIERKLQSEFGYALLRINSSSEPSWHEVRQVLTVDGKKVQDQKKARTRLVLGLRAESDISKRKLLEDLKRRGLPDSATDFSLCLLLFRMSSLSNFDFSPTETRFLGADEMQVYQFTQKQGMESFTIFEGKKVIHQALTGEVWLRKSDGLPLKIQLVSRQKVSDEDEIVDTGDVSYIRSPQGNLQPVSVIHRRTNGNLLIAENEFTYSNFKQFHSESEINFATPDPPNL